MGEEKLTKKYRKFSTRFFNKLLSTEEMIAYAKSTSLQCLGQGSSRIAFALSKSRVLKIALNERGLEQNGAEYVVSGNQNAKSAVSAIYDHKEIDGKVVWLISQLVRPIRDADEFKLLSGFSWDPYNDLVREYAKSNASLGLEEVTSSISRQYSKRLKRLKNEGDIRTASYYEELLGDLDHMITSDFFHGIVAAMKDNRLMPGDILEVDHYGKTSDGKIVLYDYGFTEEIAQKFYAEKMNRNQKRYTFPPLPLAPGEQLASRHKTLRPTMAAEDPAKTVPLRKRAAGR